MTYCLNPGCQYPENADSQLLCQHCGKRLYLGDRYYPIAILKQGSFGRTILALERGQGDREQLRQVVIKQFFSSTTAQGEAAATIDQLRQEAKRLASLEPHPQRPIFLDYLEQDGIPYLSQEFIPGQTLADVVADEGSLKEPQILKVLGDLLPVLQFIHDRQVIHGELEPENILCPDGNCIDGENSGGEYRTPFVLLGFGTSNSLTKLQRVEVGTGGGSAA